MKKILAALLLPPTVTEFEARYLARMNRVGLGFFALHVPLLALIAYFNDTGAALAALLASTVMAGPALAYRAFASPRAMSLAYGFTAMLMGGLLVHFGQGPVQIEMHFYFFALLAMLVLFGNPMAIVVAAATVALHHLVLWLVMPSSVFNYDAEVWVVGVHAAFVVVESIAACFIARSFFDNVIGLERIVQARTTELAERNHEMRRVLDNVHQGLLMLDGRGVVASQRSAMADEWLGPFGEGTTTFVDALARIDPAVARWFEVGWAEVVEGVMPLELTLAQLPARLDAGARRLALTYSPVEVREDGGLDKLLVVISDVTALVERARLEAAQRELAELFHRYTSDRRGVVELVEEGSELVARITATPSPALDVMARSLHTLKGNCGIFGLASIAEICHELEGTIVETRAVPPLPALHALAERWEVLHSGLRPLLGERSSATIEIDPESYQAVVAATRELRPHAEIQQTIEAWSLEPMALRLGRIADQARRIAARVGKPGLEVEVRHHDVRLAAEVWSGFWSSFVHVVRNAVDHGIEPADARAEAGKPLHGRIVLESVLRDDEIVISIEDDGRGLDLGRLASAAARCGVQATTPEAVLAAMFHDGVTTAPDVGELSGRGIGMGAVRAACHELGGHVVTHTDVGAGTRFEFHFPRAVAAAPQLRAA